MSSGRPTLRLPPHDGWPECVGGLPLDAWSERCAACVPGPAAWVPHVLLDQKRVHFMPHSPGTDAVWHPPPSSLADHELEQHLALIKDASLRHTLQFGIGLHHAGLPDSDRELVERLYVEGKIQASRKAWSSLGLRVACLPNSEQEIEERLCVEGKIQVSCGSAAAFHVSIHFPL